MRECCLAATCRTRRNGWWKENEVKGTIFRLPLRVARDAVRGASSRRDADKISEKCLNCGPAPGLEGWGRGRAWGRVLRRSSNDLHLVSHSKMLLSSRSRTRVKFFFHFFEVLGRELKSPNHPLRCVIQRCHGMVQGLSKLLLLMSSWDECGGEHPRDTNSMHSTPNTNVLVVAVGASDFTEFSRKGVRAGGINTVEWLQGYHLA
jgi:hypothetical protein